MASLILQQLRKRRERWVDVGDGRRVKFLRPTETDFPKMLKIDEASQKATWNVTIDHVKMFVVDWEGFSEASLLGSDIAPADQMVPFDPELFAEVVGDDADWVVKIANAILQSIVETFAKKEEKAKNSLPA